MELFNNLNHPQYPNDFFFLRKIHSITSEGKRIPLPQTATSEEEDAEPAGTRVAVLGWCHRVWAFLAIKWATAIKHLLSAQVAKCHHPGTQEIFFPLLFTAKDSFKAPDLQHLFNLISNHATSQKELCS